MRNIFIYICMLVPMVLFSQSRQELSKSDSLFALGVKLYGQKQYDKAIPLFEESDRIDKSVLDSTDKRRDYSAMWLASCYYNIGDTATAASIDMFYRFPPVDRRFTVESDSLLQSGNGYYGLKNYEKALECYFKASDIERSVLGDYHIFCANTIYFIADCYMMMNDKRALEYAGTFVEIMKRCYGEKSEYYAYSLSKLAFIHSHFGDYDKAIYVETEAVNIFEKDLNNKKHPYYLILLSDLSLYYSKACNYSEAIRIVTEALKIKEEVFSKKSIEYATSLSNMASYYSSLGDYTEAIRLGTEALNIRRILPECEKVDYANSLNNLASYYSSLGNNTEAIRLVVEALDILKNMLGEENMYYVISLGNLANYISLLGLYENAIRFETEVLRILKDNYGTVNQYYATSLNNLASYNASLGNYAEAVRLETVCMNILYDIFGEKNIKYAYSLTNLANYNSLSDNNLEAIRLGTKALDIIGTVLGKEHPDYAFSLLSLSEHYRKIKDKKTMKYCTDATRVVSDIIKKTFINLTAQERNLFWDQYREWFETYIHNIAYEFRTDSVFENGYNGILLSKGLLLNSEIEFSKLLEESGDSEVMDMYNDLTALRRHINGLSASEMILNVDSLERVAQGLERELVQRSKIYGDFTKNIAIDWRQVQQKLGDKDVAVEFVSFQTGEDSLIYAAYCLRKGMTAPRMYPLFEERQLVNIDRQELYRTKDIAELVWKPLEKELQGMKNIYFSPAGELYNIAIESVPCWVGDTLMSDKWNLYRLSSTRELALIKEHKFTDKAALYGGLEYDMSPDIMLHDSRKYTYNKRTMDFMLYNLSDSLDMREGVLPLPATKVEVEDINDYMQMAKIHSSLFTDTIGTETSFKALSGQHTRIIHVATHGFYWPDKNLPSKENLLLQGFGNYRRYIEDKAMTRSGLLFAGANNVLSGMRLPENVEDGVLTAKEISMIDLRGLDLVVLSACQTGLGEITGDGVMGLQRGFKKAGANTLLMSLWNVDDEATRLLMTKFYANLVAGKNKFESLREAQRYVRDYEIEREVTDNGGMLLLMPNEKRNKQKKNKEVKKIKPYQNPSYWAAFILLDAI